MDSQASAIERLIARIMEIPEERLHESLVDQDYATGSSVGSRQEIEAALRRYLYEKDMYEAVLYLLPLPMLRELVRGDRTNIDTLTASESVDRLFEELGLRLVPRVESTAFSVEKFGVLALRRFLSECAINANDSLRRKAYGKVEGMLLNAWKWFESFLKLTIVFYGELFRDLHFRIGSGDRPRDAFDISKLALGGILDGIDQIERKFKGDQAYAERCREICHRPTPFADLNTERIEDSTGYRNILAHWTSERISDTLLKDPKQGKKFIEYTLDPLQPVVQELIENGVAPFTMVIVARSIDVHERVIYGFIDDWAFFEPRGAEEQRRGKRALPDRILPHRLRWFYSRRLIVHSFLDMYYYLDLPPDSGSRDFISEPALINRNRVINIFEQSTSGKPLPPTRSMH